MSEDIVQRLRRIANSDLSLCSQGTPYHCDEAADEIERLRLENSQLHTDNDRLRGDRAEVESYLQAVAQCSRLHPDGYTLVDFQQVWLNQERVRSTNLAADRDEARSAVKGMSTFFTNEELAWACDTWPWLGEVEDE